MTQPPLPNLLAYYSWKQERKKGETEKLSADILAHICCAPCFTYPHKKLTEDGHKVTGFFYNPNIHPFSEYKNRLNALQDYIGLKNMTVIYGNYELERYIRGAAEADDRCRFCYTRRLEETARTAHRLGFDAFTTSLLVSPYQKHELIKEIGEEAGKKENIRFHYEDWRNGWKESRELARNFGLYMQKYCGCIFSERDRYYKPPL